MAGGLAPFRKRSRASMAKRPSRSFPKFTRSSRATAFRAYGDYSPWPGPNSNTFIQAILDAVPELNAVLPPTAIGKDYPYHGDWYGLTASRTGVFASLGGYLGLTIGWIEGIELNFFGGVVGLDIRRPALKLPGVGRLGLTRGCTSQLVWCATCLQSSLYGNWGLSASVDLLERARGK